MQIGIPVKLLHQGTGFTIIVELKTGECAKGILIDVEDNMNLLIENVLFTQKNGAKSNQGKIFIRGSQIEFVILPSMLSYSPVFKKNNLETPVAVIKK
uniref:Small nuclear ribonucleoprotein Sm D3 n=1 Tax=Dermatophagoides pteronyssinus TaxID=6956 RepID=A0A6P6YA35_DERPT|nr:small nuclear ribonucleoprotein SmD3b-like [Dermatophagoides pteronyssinus]